jgi:hypothetical protein
MHLTATAGTALVVGLDHDLFARQVLGQRATIDTALPGARRFQRRVGLLRLGLALGHRLLDAFERQLELIGVGRLLGAPPARRSSLRIARSCSFCPASRAAVARSASSKTFSAATSSGSGAPSEGLDEELMGVGNHTACAFVMY